MEHKYIMVSESLVGSHKRTEEIARRVSMHAMTFPVTIASHEGKYYVSTDLKSNEVFIQILKEYKEHKKDNTVSILVSFDLDENGEIMAEALLDSLAHHGVDPFDIFRVPLTEKGYVAIKNFSNTDSYKEFLYHQQQILKLLQANSLPQMGIYSIFSIKRLSQYKGKEFATSTDNLTVNPHGTSTATFVHNFMQSQN